MHCTSTLLFCGALCWGIAALVNNAKKCILQDHNTPCLACNYSEANFKISSPPFRWSKFFAIVVLTPNAFLWCGLVSSIVLYSDLGWIWYIWLSKSGHLDVLRMWLQCWTLMLQLIHDYFWNAQLEQLLVLLNIDLTGHLLTFVSSFQCQVNMWLEIFLLLYCMENVLRLGYL